MFSCGAPLGFVKSCDFITKSRIQICSYRAPLGFPKSCDFDSKDKNCTHKGRNSSKRLRLRDARARVAQTPLQTSFVVIMWILQYMREFADFRNPYFDNIII